MEKTWRPRITVLIGIFLAVLAAAVILALVRPSNDDAGGWGNLLGVVWAIASLVYLLGSIVHHELSRKRNRKPIPPGKDS